VQVVRWFETKDIYKVMLKVCPGANSTILGYNASVVKINDGTSSPVRLENKNVFFSFEKRYSLNVCLGANPTIV
jgi:hypothetical protein